MSQYTITDARVLTPDGIVEADVALRDGRVARLGGPAEGAVIEADGALLLPGIVDLHGDAFERQVMPRPGVAFPIDVAVMETDRQLVANGITTGFYGLTYSWEPGLRGRAGALALVEALARLRPRLGCDSRLHLRWETFNLEAEQEVAGWLADGTVHLLAFNDHVDSILKRFDRPEKMAEYAGRAGMTIADFVALAERVAARRAEVPGAIARLAGIARAHEVPMASHDDDTPETRRHFAELGSTLCEFPYDAATAREGLKDGGHVILGSPNVLRGRSHIDRLAAREAAAEGLVTILSSDYYFPALAQAPFTLAALGKLPLERAWALVSTNPAHAVGLSDRGEIAPGQRADLVLIDDSDTGLVRPVATFAAGRLVHRAEPARPPLSDAKAA